MAILRTLMELAMNSEVMQNYSLQRSEHMFVARPDGGFNLTPVDPGDDLETMEARGFQSPTLQPGEGEKQETWYAWLEGCRVGLRRPLGTDFRRRRYWAFGHRAGCWQVFVESYEGGGWGWYEGDALDALVGWLREGGIQMEQPLLRVLEVAPRPMKHTQGGWVVGGWVHGWAWCGWMCMGRAGCASASGAGSPT